MKKVLVGFIMATTLIAVLSAYAAGDNVAGKWKMFVEAHDGFALDLVLVQDGTIITGTLSNPHGEDFHIKGEFAGGKIRFAAASTGENAIPMSANGSLKTDGTLAGSLTSTMGDMTWTAVRANPK